MSTNHCDYEMAIIPLDDSKKKAAADDEYEQLTRIERWFGETQHALDTRSRITAPMLVTIGLVYFLQGCIGMILLALRFHMMLEGQGPLQVAEMMALVFIPWIPKFAYGFLSDGFPLLGYHRKTYLFLGALLTFVGLFVSALELTDLDGVKTLFITVFLSIAVCDVIADAVVVEKSEGKPRKVATNLQALANISRGVGAIISSFGGGYLMELSSPQALFGACSAFPILLMVASVAMPEDKATRSMCSSAACADTTSKFKLLFTTLFSRDVFFPVLFVFTLMATPTSARALEFFIIYKLQWEPSFLGILAGVSAVASVLATVAYSKYLARFSLRSIFLFSTLLAFVLGLMPLFLITGVTTSKAFAISDSFINMVTAQFQTMAVLVMVSMICPPGIEGVLFATIMGFINAAQSLSEYLSGVLTTALDVDCAPSPPSSPGAPPGMECNFDNAVWLIVVCQLTTLLPLLLLCLVPSMNKDGQVPTEEPTVPSKTKNKVEKGDDGCVVDETDDTGVIFEAALVHDRTRTISVVIDDGNDQPKIVPLIEEQTVVDQVTL